MKRRHDGISERCADRKRLRQAWGIVQTAGGGAGVDRQTLETFSQDLERHLLELEQQLRGQNYRFSRLRVAMLPKANGKKRRLGIPTVRDRIVLQTIKMCIGPRCESQMHESSHAYRPGRSAMTALESINRSLRKGARFVFETDIAAFFDSIQHRPLREKLAHIEPHTRASRLVQQSMTLSPHRWRARKGLSQGSPLSPLLANVALTDFDHELEHCEGTMIRYADDLLVLCHSAAAADQAEATIRRLLREIGLTLNAEKTSTIDSHSENFQFLGFDFRPDRIVPDSKNLVRLRSGIAAWCNPHLDDGWRSRIENINQLLRSFAWYYHRTDATRLFLTLDSFVHQSLVELEKTIGAPHHPWEETLVKMSAMREVGWRGKKSKKKSRRWNGYR